MHTQKPAHERIIIVGADYMGELGRQWAREHIARIVAQQLRSKKLNAGLLYPEERHALIKAMRKGKPCRFEPVFRQYREEMVAW